MTNLRIMMWHEPVCDLHAGFFCRARQDKKCGCGVIIVRSPIGLMQIILIISI